MSKTPITDMNPKYTEKKTIHHEFIITAENKEQLQAELDIFEIMRKEIAEVVKKHSTPILR